MRVYLQMVFEIVPKICPFLDTQTTIQTTSSTFLDIQTITYLETYKHTVQTRLTSITKHELDLKTGSHFSHGSTLPMAYHKKARKRRQGEAHPNH
jgi:hypothetical protein